MDALIASFTAYGLSGAVIGALFVALYLLIKELKVMNNSHDDRIDAQAAIHKEERAEWLKVCKDNTDVLLAFSSKRCIVEGRKSETT